MIHYYSLLFIRVLTYLAEGKVTPLLRVVGVRRGAAVVAHADLVIDRMAKVLAGLHAGWPNACAPYHIRLSRNGLLLKICPKLVFGCTKADFCD